MEDFDQAFLYFEMLWDYNTYEKDTMREIYQSVITNDHAFAFFLTDREGGYHGFCHGDYYITFWLSGLTCYISSLITNPEERGRGYGIMLMDHARELALEKGCKGITLMSGLPRKEAHRFYETYGFEKGCYGFDLLL